MPMTGRVVAMPSRMAIARVSQRIFIDPVEGAVVEQIVGKLYATPKSELERARKLYAPE